MNDTVRLLCSHRSIRKFTADPIPDEQLEAIIAAAQAASTSSYLQAASIIRVTDPEKRARLVECSGGQKWVGTAAEFLVWCTDFHRLKQIVPEARLGYTEQLLIGAIDTAIMAENALVAAESLGLGGLFIGGLRNHPDKVVELLDLPKNVAPLFGMCLGRPAEDPMLRPRLPQALILHENRYNPELDHELLEQFDRDVTHYYKTRPGASRITRWTDQIAATLSREARPHMKAFLESQGFGLK
jgi:nitroreductase